MGRPSKLTPAQWQQVEARLLTGDGVRDLAREFGVSPAAVSKRNVAKQSKQVQAVAKQVADAQIALAELPVAHQYLAVNLADKLRNVSASLASAAELGAATAHRLQALANSEVSKVDDAQLMASIDTLRNVGVLTKLANDSAATGLSLIAAAKRDAPSQRETPAEPDWASQMGGGAEDPSHTDGR